MILKMYLKVADELTQSELVLGVGSGVGLCITVLLVVGLWVRHAKCGQRSEVLIINADLTDEWSFGFSYFGWHLIFFYLLIHFCLSFSIIL